jgi:hypothetical protein
MVIRIPYTLSVLLLVGDHSLYSCVDIKYSRSEHKEGMIVLGVESTNSQLHHESSSAKASFFS